MVDKELVNDANKITFKFDVDKDGTPDFEITINKAAMKKLSVRIAKWLLMTFGV